jgi:phage-related tail fiber protein
MVPVGTILPYGGNVLDARVIDRLKDNGWLVCDGHAVERNNYDELFDVIGVAFGAGDGESTFNLPDLRGLFLRGVDHGQKRDPDAEARTALHGGAQGDKVGSVQEDAFKQHSHGYIMFPRAQGKIASGRVWQHGPAQTDPTGGNETRPKNIYVNFIIKAK